MIVRDGDWTLFDYDQQTGRQVWTTQNGLQYITVLNRKSPLTDSG